MSYLFEVTLKKIYPVNNYTCNSTQVYECKTSFPKLDYPNF